MISKKNRVTTIIELQAQELQTYFNKLLEFKSNYAEFSSYIKPGMVLEIWRFLEYWIRTLCHCYDHSRVLDYSLKFTKDEDSKNIYTYLKNLYEIRKVLVHTGGYVSDKKLQHFPKMEGMHLGSHNLIGFDNMFISESLKNAKSYLCTISNVTLKLK
jgi:hypothetical protein